MRAFIVNLGVCLYRCFIFNGCLCVFLILMDLHTHLSGCLSVSCLLIKGPSIVVPVWENYLFFVPLKQLRANLREMEKLCARVRAEDADALEALVKPVRDRALAAAQNFLLLHSNPVSQLTPPPTPGSQTSSCASSSSYADGEVGEEPVSDRQIQLHLPEIPADQSAAESWDKLEEVRMCGQYVPEVIFQ